VITSAARTGGSFRPALPGAASAAAPITPIGTTSTIMLNHRQAAQIGGDVRFPLALPAALLLRRNVAGPHCGR
jgi:hypothetical protein